MLDNSSLYLKTDVLLLCDVFENYRKLYINTYDLDSPHYYTAPGPNWDAMLKYTRIELEHWIWLIWFNLIMKKLHLLDQVSGVVYLNVVIAMRELIRGGLWCRETKFIYHIFWCQQFKWLGYVSISSYWWIWMGKSEYRF